MVIYSYPAVSELIVPHAKQYCCTLRYRSLAVDYVLYCMLYAHSRMHNCCTCYCELNLSHTVLRASPNMIA
jgi:hypothetical protein